MPDIDEDVMRELMIRSTANLFARPAATAETLRRQRQRRLRTRVLGVTGIAAAAGLAVGTLAIPSGAQPAARPGVAAGSPGATHAARLTAAQKTLYGLSTAAAATQRPAGRYVVLTEKSADTQPGGAGGETGPKTSVIDTVTGGGVTYQDITVSGANGDPQPPAVLNAPADSSPTTAQLDAMPTSTAGLRAFLLSQARQQLNQAYAEMAQQAKKAGKRIATPIPKGPQPTDNDLVFEQAANLLWEPHLSSALRAAVYRVLADTPGVQVKSEVTDSAGRPAVEISRIATFSKENVETFENPRT